VRVVDDTDDEVVGGVFVSVAHEGTQIAVAARVATTAVRIVVFGATDWFGVIATSASDVLRVSDTATWATRCDE
jgi:hypothetical protein